MTISKMADPQTTKINNAKRIGPTGALSSLVGNWKLLFILAFYIGQYDSDFIRINRQYFKYFLQQITQTISFLCKEIVKLF